MSGWGWSLGSGQQSNAGLRPGRSSGRMAMANAVKIPQVLRRYSVEVLSTQYSLLARQFRLRRQCRDKEIASNRIMELAKRCHFQSKLHRAVERVKCLIQFSTLAPPGHSPWLSRSSYCTSKLPPSPYWKKSSIHALYSGLQDSKTPPAHFTLSDPGERRGLRTSPQSTSRLVPRAQR